MVHNLTVFEFPGIAIIYAHDLLSQSKAPLKIAPFYVERPLLFLRRLGCYCPHVELRGYNGFLCPKKLALQRFASLV